MTSARDTAAPERRACPFRRRCLADLVDSLFIVLIARVLFAAGVGFSTVWPERHFDQLDYAVLLVWNHASLWLPGLLYSIMTALVLGLCCRGLVGGTPGERILAIELIDKRGGPVGPVRGCIKGIVTWMGIIPLGFGYLWALVDTRRQSLAEHISGTVLVVRNQGSRSSLSG